MSFLPLPFRVLPRRLAATRSCASAAVRQVASAWPERLYFRQLVPGKDVATSNSQVHELSRQMANYMYLLGDAETREAVVIDGAWDPHGINAVAVADGMKITSHIATHFHWDHIGAASVSGLRIPGLFDWICDFRVPAYVPRWEAMAAAKQVDIDVNQLNSIDEDQSHRLGAFELEFLHTPGHSPGSCCIRVSCCDNGEKKDILLITGDTVFPGSCGRLDLPESDPEVMYDSLRKLARLSDDLPIFPGHGYSGARSTIGRERQSGLLQEMSREQWNRMMA